jgi:LysM repeat protein
MTDTTAGFANNTNQDFASFTGGATEQPESTTPVNVAPTPPVPPFSTPATDQPSTPALASDVPATKDATSEIQAQIDAISEQVKNKDLNLSLEKIEEILASLKKIHSTILEESAKGELEKSQAESLDQEVTEDIHSLQQNLSGDSSLSDQEKTDTANQLSALQQEVSILSAATAENEDTVASAEPVINIVSDNPAVAEDIQPVIPTDNQQSDEPEPSEPSQPTEEPNETDEPDQPTESTEINEPNPPQAHDTKVQYTVQPGDSMMSIAEANNLSLEQIQTLNPQVSNPKLIFPGEQLNI